MAKSDTLTLGLDHIEELVLIDMASKLLSNIVVAVTTESAVECQRLCMEPKTRVGTKDVFIRKRHCGFFRMD